MTDPSRRLLPGTVELAILSTLSDGPMHGFGVSRMIRARTEGVVDMEDAALYQALHRMEKRGWLEAEWGVSENNRRAKFYRLTREGRRRLESEVAAWREYAGAVSRLLGPA